MNASDIKEHMEVVGADGQHVGTVDHLDGDRIKLTRTDKSAGGQHHYLPLSTCAGVEGGKLKLSIPAQQAKAMQEGGPQPGR